MNNWISYHRETKENFDKAIFHLSNSATVELNILATVLEFAQD